MYKYAILYVGRWINVAVAWSAEQACVSVCLYLCVPEL